MSGNGINTDTNKQVIKMSNNLSEILARKYVEDPNVKKVFENKRVAIVGPSPHILGKNLGEIIDEYDIVCRVNNIPGKELSKDYGGKTDVLFFNCATRLVDNFVKDFTENKKGENLKMIICPVIKSAGNENVRSFRIGQKGKVEENFKIINKLVWGGKLKFSWIGVENYRIFYDIMGGIEPYSGVIGLSMILLSQPKELFITGYSFYDQGKTAGEVYFDSHGKLNTGYHENMSAGTGHPKKPQIAYFKEILNSSFRDKITLDIYLNDILCLGHDKTIGWK